MQISRCVDDGWLDRQTGQIKKSVVGQIYILMTRLLGHKIIKHQTDAEIGKQLVQWTSIHTDHSRRVQTFNNLAIWLCILQLVTMRLLTLYIGTHYSQLWNIYTNSVYSLNVDNTCLLFIDCCCLNPDTPAPLTLPSRAIEIRNGDGSTDWSRRSSPSPVIIKPIRPKPKGKPAATQAQPSWGFRKPPSVPTLSSDKVRDSGGSKCWCCINFTVLSLDVDLVLQLSFHYPKQLHTTASIIFFRCVLLPCF